jgi:hypothetical protein
MYKPRIVRLSLFLDLSDIVNSSRIASEFVFRRLFRSASTPSLKLSGKEPGESLGFESLGVIHIPATSDGRGP